MKSSMVSMLYDTTLKYLVIYGSASTTDLSISSEKTPSVSVILSPDSSVRTVSQASSSHNWISVTGHSF